MTFQHSKEFGGGVIASQAPGEEANDDGDDDGRATASYSTAWQEGTLTTKEMIVACYFTALLLH